MKVGKYLFEVTVSFNLTQRVLLITSKDRDFANVEKKTLTYLMKHADDFSAPVRIEEIKYKGILGA